MNQLVPMQPYFVLHSKKFYQEAVMGNGISHFYGYEGAYRNQTVIAVPDGCMDLIFEYELNGNVVDIFLCGSVLGFQKTIFKEKKKYFGVRFQPGYGAELFDFSMKELIGNQYSMKFTPMGIALMERMSGKVTFTNQVACFREIYEQWNREKRQETIGKALLIETTKRMIYDTQGKVKVKEIEEETGYCARYINRTFTERMGISPKNFSKIVQFQRALYHLIYTQPDKLSDAALDFGYYDQAQFIRDFRQFANITPGEYLRILQNGQYRKRIVNSKETLSSDFYKYY